jgi:hypothetical protein
VGETRNAARQPADQRYESAYLFGAICPARGTGAALALPFADTEAMQLHLDEIARTVAKGRLTPSCCSTGRLAHYPSPRDPEEHHHDPPAITRPGA